MKTWSSESIQSTLNAENKMKTFCVVLSLNIDKKNFLISFLTVSLSVVVSVTIISYECVNFNKVNESEIQVINNESEISKVSSKNADHICKET